jgi:endonuclease YncB( thermonuclease family)
MSLKQWSPYLFVMLVVGFVVLWQQFLQRADETAGNTAQIQVGDGDSFTLDKVAYRLDGIDAPEMKQNCQSADGSIWRCGGEARRQLQSLLRRGEVRCVTRIKDRYGRSIATCSANGVPDIAEALVRDGWAISAAKLGEGKYAVAEKEARDAKRGIWQGPFERPAAYRLQNPREDEKPKRNP